MKLHVAFCVLVSSLALCQTNPPGVSDLLKVLQSDPDTQAFGQLLGQHPDLIQNLDTTKQFTVFAPSNEAVAAFQKSINGSIARRAHNLHRRSLPEYAAAIALLFTDRSNQANLNFAPTDLITNLTDPDFINIEPASASASPTSSGFSLPQSSLSSASSASSSVLSTTISASPSSSTLSPSSTPAPVSSTFSSAPGDTLGSISSPAQPTSSAGPPPPPPGKGANIPSQKKKGVAGRSLQSISNHYRRQQNQASLQLYSGFGDTTEASESETPYNNGAVRKTDSFLTLFGDLASTLEKTNGTAFADSLAKAGTLDSLSKTPRITLFVPNDAVLTGQVLDARTLQQYILPNTLATTTSLTGGTFKTSSGDTVVVTVDNSGTVSVNNATIVKPNVMIKNGVIHYIDNVYTGQFTGSASGLTRSMLSVAVAVAVSCAALL